LGQKVSRATGIVAKSGRVGQGAIQFGKTLAKPIRPISTIAKALTVSSAGDIPKMLDDWKKKGAEIMDKVPQQKTLGRIPSFQRFSTQQP
jgi:hypothetical protein